MTLLEAFDYGVANEARLGRRVQRLTALGLAALCVAAAAAMEAKAGYLFAGWFVLAAALPAIVGRLIATCVGVGAALVVFMGESGMGTTFRPLVALALAPVLFLAGILWSRRFAAYAGLFIGRIFASVFAPRA